MINRTTLVSELNRIPGVNNVSFGADGSNDDTAATVSGFIGDRIYLSYGVGIYEPINVLIARIYLRTRLWLEVVSRLENSVDLYYAFDIDLSGPSVSRWRQDTLFANVRNLTVNHPGGTWQRQLLTGSIMAHWQR